MPRRPDPQNLGLAPCGRAGIAAYRKGCRCPTCRAAVAAKQRAYFQRIGGNRWRSDAPQPPKPWNDARREAYHRRRALKQGATVERFSHAEVFERDGWICGLCGEPVDRELSWPDRQSASLDHVVPLSLGGEHSRANTQLAHVSCNVRKGRRAA